MRGLIIESAEAGARLELAKLPEPVPEDGDLLVEGLALGVCGTDRSLLARGLRRSPAGQRMVVGHESLGRVVHAPSGSSFRPGDLVTGLVRRPDPEPCPNCANGDPDICLNGNFTERGIKASDGYGAERYLLGEDYAVAVNAQLGLTGVLFEPTSIVAKAWERLDAAARRPGDGRSLILGAGPIGLLAALLATQRGYETHVVDRVSGGPKVSRVRALGATYHRGTDGLTGRFDAIVECTGELVGEAIAAMAPGGALCLVAGGHRGSVPDIELSALSAAMTGGNRTITGISSSHRRHFEAGAAALSEADRDWLVGLLTTTTSLEDYAAAFESGPDTIKSVIRLTADDI